MIGLMSLNRTELSKLIDALQPYKVKCRCGHSMYIVSVDRKICSWCGNWVYKNKLTEMKYELEKRGVKCGRR